MVMPISFPLDDPCLLALVHADVGIPATATMAHGFLALARRFGLVCMTPATLKIGPNVLITDLQHPLSMTMPDHR